MSIQYRRPFRDNLPHQKRLEFNITDQQTEKMIPKPNLRTVKPAKFREHCGQVNRPNDPENHAPPQCIAELTDTVEPLNPQRKRKSIIIRIKQQPGEVSGNARNQRIAGRLGKRTRRDIRGSGRRTDCSPREMAIAAADAETAN
jgi:hypothetical protein